MNAKFLLLTGVAASMAIHISAQEKREINWQDFKTSLQTTGVVHPVKWGSLTVFQITDINKFLYKVTIAGNTFELQTPVPSELQTLFRLTPTELQKNAASPKIQEAANQTTAAANKVSRAYSAEKKARIDRNTTNAEQAEAGPVETALETLNDTYQEYLEKVKMVLSDVMAVRQTRNKLISIAQKDISFVKIQEALGNVEWPLNGIDRNYNDIRSLYAQTLLAIETVRSATGVSEQVIAFIDALSANLKKADALITEESLLSIIDDVDYLYTELANKNNFIINAPPVQMDGDLISYEVTITPVATKALAPFRNPMKFTFDVPAKGGLKVDFSVGPLVSFGEDAKDEKYFLDPVIGTDSVAIQSRINNNDITPGIGAFMHVYPRTGKWSGVGGVFGIGAGFQNTSDINFSLYLGLTAVLGKSQKVMGSVGVSYLKVQRIKNDEFKIGNKYAVTKVNLNDITESVYKPSAFISISYSLSAKTQIK